MRDSLSICICALLFLLPGCDSGSGSGTSTTGGTTSTPATSTVTAEQMMVSLIKLKLDDGQAVNTIKQALESNQPTKVKVMAIEKLSKIKTAEATQLLAWAHPKWRSGANKLEVTRILSKNEYNFNIKDIVKNESVI